MSLVLEFVIVVPIHIHLFIPSIFVNLLNIINIISIHSDFNIDVNTSKRTHTHTGRHTHTHLESQKFRKYANNRIVLVVVYLLSRICGCTCMYAVVTGAIIYRPTDLL